MAEFFVILQVIEQGHPILMVILALAKAIEIAKTVQGSTFRLSS